METVFDYIFPILIIGIVMSFIIHLDKI